MAARGVILAAPASGSGKTVLTLGLLRALSRQFQRIGAFKVGPDYIDPAFHAAATGRPSFNIDLWAMRPATVARILRRLDDDSDLIVGEGVMGLFDGAADNSGSTADVAALTGLPVVLVVDVRGQAASVAALLRGFMGHRADVPVAGVILNRVGGPAHEAMLRQAVAPLGLPVLGAVPRDGALALPDRHLGLVQAAEHDRLEEFVSHAARRLEATVDLQRLADLAQPLQIADAGAGPAPPPLGQRIAVARDTAFSFLYPALLASWQQQGADLGFFSPLADEAPADDADAVYLPGGYPELHGGRLAAASRFKDGLRRAATSGAAVYGECGGYMVMGESLLDAGGQRHAMAGLLPVCTSFVERRLHLGYRQVALQADAAFGSAGQKFRGHEFHYATILREEGEPLFGAADARGESVGTMGLRRGRVAGSFCHLIDSA
ncbi:MAG: cobyrinate a,c-diamide synthase [Dongiaceae bacterium]